MKKNKDKKYIEYKRKVYTEDAGKTYHSFYDSKAVVATKRLYEGELEKVFADVVNKFKDAGYEICDFNINIGFYRTIDKNLDIVQCVTLSEA